MQSISKAQLWAGRILSGIVVLFFLFDGVPKVMRLAPVVEASGQLGFPESSVFLIGVLALTGAVLYAVPRTSVLGAIFLTGFLGGATAAQVRVGNPLFSHTLFPSYIAVLMWGGLLLRDARLRALLLARPEESKGAEQERAAA